MTVQEAGKKGGSVKSEAKAKAARENGKKGGRPKKKDNE
jgi:general stress protein YciG